MKTTYPKSTSTKFTKVKKWCSSVVVNIRYLVEHKYTLVLLYSTVMLMISHVISWKEVKTAFQNQTNLVEKVHVTVLENQLVKLTGEIPKYSEIKKDVLKELVPLVSSSNLQTILTKEVVKWKEANPSNNPEKLENEIKRVLRGLSSKHDHVYGDWKTPKQIEGDLVIPSFFSSRSCVICGDSQVKVVQ